MLKILNDIYLKKKEELEITKKKYSISSLQKLINKKDNRKFSDKLIKCQKEKENCIIAEIKKASPSAGLIIKDYKPDDIAIQYEKSGAGAISILTEKNFFQGSIDHLSLISRKTNIPILRKDFIIDAYQIFESKIFDADAILLIVAILSDSEIYDFIKIAEDIGLDCIIETHTTRELERALKINYPIIGINNRNLDTLEIDNTNTLKLIKEMPNNFTIIAESGIKSHNDIIKYNECGIYNFLIGESILRSKDINLKFKELLKNDHTSK